MPEFFKKVGIKDILLTKGFEKTFEKDNLAIFSNSTIRTDQYMLFYTRPMGTSVTGEDIITARDSIGKNYMEGDLDGSYIATEMRLPPSQKTLEIDVTTVPTIALTKL